MIGVRLFAALVVLNCVLYVAVDGGCVEFQRCCRGKDGTCRAYGQRMVKSNATTCFCDESCLLLGDCCTDYADACKAVDCVQGDWGDWGDCSETCGWGYMTRFRPVITEGVNGGVKCEQTSQKTYCLGVFCKGKRQSNGWRESRETAKIVPAEYGSYRSSKLYDPYADIRKNLFHHYKADQKIDRPAYCAKFEITETRKACSNSINTPWAHSLQVGTTVCVECQPSAMKKSLGVRCKGHGVYLSETHWNAITVPDCHGKWTMSTQHEDCSCDPKSDLSYIFV